MKLDTIQRKLIQVAQKENKPALLDSFGYVEIIVVIIIIMRK